VVDMSQMSTELGTVRMIQYNRAGKNLPASRRRELERAKRILQQRAARQKARAQRATRAS